jgi:cystathionine beta-lyase
LWQRDFSGSSGLFAIIMQDYPEAAIEAFIDGLRFYGIGASWGGYESLILPGDPSSTRTATRWQARGQLLRIHAGLEDVEDLKSDLARGFDRLNALVG